MGWTEKVRKLTVELLRAGGCEGFDDVVEAVLASAEEEGHKALKEAGRDPETRTYFENVDVKIPKVVVEQGAKALKEAIGEIVILDEEEGNGKDEGEQTR